MENKKMTAPDWQEQERLERLERILSVNFSDYPSIIQGRFSYVLSHNGSRMCGDLDIPQELAGEFEALVDKIERFNAEKSM